MAFTTILTPVIIIGLIAITLGDLLWTLITSFKDILELIKSFSDPEIFMRDLTHGIFTGIQIVIWSSMDLFKGILMTITNKLGISDNFFGLNVKNKDANDNIREKLNELKCVKPTFLKYIILVICPPLYVFMVKGINGWMYIILDILFTFLFYFPGLLYALLICNTC